MPVFVRLTLLAAAAIVALIVLLFLVKVLFFAGIIAALVIAGAFIANRLRRRLGVGQRRWTALPASLNPFYVLFDIALAALAVRSLVVLGRRAPWTSVGWAATVGYGLSAAYAYTGHGWRPGIAVTAYSCLAILGLAFVIAAIRREPRADPWWWPRP